MYRIEVHFSHKYDAGLKVAASQFGFGTEPILRSKWHNTYLTPSFVLNLYSCKLFLGNIYITTMCQKTEKFYLCVLKSFMYTLQRCRNNCRSHIFGIS